MSKRVQVILEEAERERFRQIAHDEGLSLSAWLREAGRQRADAARARKLRTVQDLRKFFARIDEREQGVEPDWNEHEAAIERSIAEGAAES